MKSPIFYNKIACSTAHRQSRENIANEILTQPADFAALVATVFDLKDQHHYKACWILELVLDAKLDLIVGFLDAFCQGLPFYKQHGAVRSVSKICLFLMQKHALEFKKNRAFLTETQFGKITETCLDWIIADIKVASKVYAMRALFEAGKTNIFLHRELSEIIEKDLPNIPRHINLPQKIF